jgi:hypothetical protein
LEAEGIFARFLLIAFLVSPCYEPYETPKNAIKKTLNKTTEGEKNRRKKKAAFFVMSPEGFFQEKVFPVFLNSPCYETPKKRLKKNRLQKKKASNYIFL